jgi:hypothetical protein
MVQEPTSHQPNPVFVATSKGFNRDFYFLYLPDITGWPENLSLPDKYFGLFLACDARELSDELIRGVAKTAMDQGLAYLCAWGPDCERVHDVFDFAEIDKEILEPESDPDSVVMTTWHAKDSLREAIWYFKVSAFGAGRFESCRIWLAVNVGHPDLSSEIMGLLKNEDWQWET